MNNKGFTLIEVLSVVVIMALVAAVAIPTSFSISNKVKNKMLNNKMELAEKAAVLWGIDNSVCLSIDNYCENVSCYVDANDNNLMHCKVMLIKLASDGYLNYDEENKIINPVNKKDISSSTITLDYNLNNKNINAIDYKVIEN